MSSPVGAWVGSGWSPVTFFLCLFCDEPSHGGESIAVLMPSGSFRVNMHIMHIMGQTPMCPVPIWTSGSRAAPYLPRLSLLGAVTRVDRVCHARYSLLADSAASILSSFLTCRPPPLMPSGPPGSSRPRSETPSPGRRGPGGRGKEGKAVGHVICVGTGGVTSPIGWWVCI